MTKGRWSLQLFFKDEEGVFAILFAIMSVILVALAGACVDYVTWASATKAAQDAVDAGVLAAAASSVERDIDVTAVVAGFANPALHRWKSLSLQSADYDPATRRVTASVHGNIETAFVQLVGVHSLPVFVVSTAERATNGRLELALVLDNTWSMSDGDGSGKSKISSLKEAANLLLTTLWDEDNENIRVGVIPYAQYVNVGTQNRSQPWMSVAPDSTTTSSPPPRTCEQRTTRQYCTKGPTQTCTRYIDGVRETYDCTPQTCETRTVAPYEYCTGGGSATTSTTTWFGCVQSRKKATIRLTDLEPHTPYMGIMQTKPTCMTPIVPLSNDLNKLRSAIAAMQPANSLNSGYKPLTYIPAGMLWGVNVLSPTQPFNHGEQYDQANKDPRKAIVLMTDGDNTLRHDNGNHVGLSSNTTTAANQVSQTDADTLALCKYAKDAKIEIFTVSFGAIGASSQTMLQDCASDHAHYFAATSAAQLSEAFKNIADKLRVVRLVQ